VSDILYRAELRTPEQARVELAKNALPWVGEQLHQGRELVAEFRLLDDDITDKQRNFLHGVVLTEIALYARVNGGQQFPMKVWKEYFRDRLLPDRRLTSVNPFTGRKTRRRVRVSTEDLGVRRLAKYIDEVIAIAATELGVQVSEPLPPELRPQRRRARQIEQQQVDPETGEILETA
jgi:hypothetical protein